MATIEQQMNGNQNRRMANESRCLANWDKLSQREDDAEQMIGELCRNGKTVYYTFPQGGKYREGSRLELVAYLVRNNYA